MAIQIARTYHVERGEHDRWQVISPAQAYHGPTMETLALTGRPGLHGPFGPYFPHHLHIPPSTWRFDPTGEAALAALDRALEEAGPETVSAFFCEPISAAALPAGAHVGRSPAGVRRGPGGPARAAVRGTRRARPRTRREAPGRAGRGAGRHPDGPRGPRPRLPAGCVVRRSARRRFVPAARA